MSSEEIDRLQAEIDRLEEQNKKLRVRNRRWMRIAGTDDLTALPNKVFFSTALLPQAISRSNAEGHPLACIMLAPDNLGDINKRFGRKGGDQIVTEVAEYIKGKISPTEKLVHFDGANFVVLIPKGELVDGRKRSLALRAGIVSRHFQCDSEVISLTLSMGIVARSPSPEGVQINTKEVVEEFFRRLVLMLDQAKQQGGDRPVEDEDMDF
jgi:diguanylate cyclase (GGDEF)-like protein